MPRMSDWYRAVQEVSDGQDHLIAAWQLREIGVPRSSQSRRVAGYMWTLVVRGIHLVTGGQPNRRQRDRAAVMYGGVEARLTGRTGLRLMGYRSLDLQDHRIVEAEPAFVLVPHDRQRAGGPFVVTERTRRMPTSVRAIDGLPVVPAARAVADAARRIRVEGDVVALVVEAIRRGVSIDALREELECGSRRGSAHLAAALDAVGRNQWSPPEATVGALLEALGFGHAMYNMRVLSTVNGEYIGQPDAWLDDIAVAVETDSERYHSSGDGWIRTLRRQERYSRHGVVCVSVIPAELAAGTDETERRILAAVAAAAARPRPPVRALPARIPRLDRDAG